MQRLSTIAIDSTSAAVPEQWSGSWVQRRLIEAYSVERRLPQARRRLLIASAWPAMAVEFSDIVGRADDDRKERFQAWEYATLGVSAQDISRMEQAHDWLRLILAPYPEERLCLMQWAAAVAYHRSLRSLMLKRQWSRSTFYRMISAGAHVIALELKRQGQPVV
jgi:hypothetical protein